MFGAGKRVRHMIKLGVVVIILATVIFVAAMVAPDVLTPLAPLFCGPNETLSHETFTYSIPGETSTSTDYACVDSEGQSRDVTDNLMFVTVGVFVVGLLAGVGLTIAGGIRSSQRQTQALAEQAAMGMSPGLSGERPDWLNNLKSRGSAFSPDSEKPTLTATLRDLEDAHQQGLITDAEYERLRAEALDKLV